MYSLAEDYWGHYIKVDMMGRTCTGKKCLQNSGDQNLQGRQNLCNISINGMTQQ